MCDKNCFLNYSEGCTSLSDASFLLLRSIFWPFFMAEKEKWIKYENEDFPYLELQIRVFFKFELKLCKFVTTTNARKPVEKIFIKKLLFVVCRYKRRCSGRIIIILNVIYNVEDMHSKNINNRFLAWIGKLPS